MLAAIQETKFTDKFNKNTIGDFSLIRKDRVKNKGGGLAFIVHKDIPYTIKKTNRRLEADEFIEELTITLDNRKRRIDVRNIYIPPVSSCNPNYRPALHTILEGLGDDFIIMGDFNAHHPEWDALIGEDSRGTALFEAVQDAGANEDGMPTRSFRGIKSSPDITLTSQSICSIVEWRTKQALGSDHIPILITLRTEIENIPSKKRHLLTTIRRTGMDLERR